MGWDGEHFRYAHSQKKKIHQAPTMDQALYQAWDKMVRKGIVAAFNDIYTLKEKQAIK